MTVQNSQTTTQPDGQLTNKARKSPWASVKLGIAGAFILEMLVGTLLKALPAISNIASNIAVLGAFCSAAVLFFLEFVPKLLSSSGENSRLVAFQGQIKRAWQQASLVPTILTCLLLLLVMNGLVIAIPYVRADPYTHSTVPVLSDPLQNNNQGYAWLEQQGSCEFFDGQYHAIVRETAHVRLCSAQATNYSNFVYEVRMTIMAGDCGAITFRSDDANSRMYFFRICQNGTYLLGRYGGNSPSTGSNTSPILAEKLTPQSIIHQGLHQSNLIAVVVNGGAIELWINHQHISTVNDDTYRQGRIGLAANSFKQPTEVVFSDVRVWTFE